MPLRDILSQPANNAELIAGGGKSQVPCLRIEDDEGGVRWMYESIEIVQYLKTELS
jgi:glutathione S-transferase